MMFPRDRTVYANLNTSFTSFEALLRDVGERHLTGYVEVTFPGYSGTLLFSAGEFVNGCELDGPARATGPGTLDRIAGRAAGRDGAINVYTAFPDVVALVNRLLDGRALYRDLNSAFTSLDRLIAKLRSDGLTGYVEVQLAEDSGAGVIYLQQGEPIESVFAGRGEETTTGQEALNRIVAAVGTSGGSFNVFAAAPEPAPASLVAPSAPAPSEPVETRREQVLALWSETLQRAESFVDGISRRGRFSLAFREVLVAQAATYPYLDPFAAEFSFTGGQVQFDGPLPEDFNRALCDCLGDTISKLAFQLKRSDLEARVRGALEGISEKHVDTIHRFQLGDDLQEFVA